MNKEQEMPLISGTTERCLKHLAKAMEGEDFFSKRRRIADFADVNDSSVHSWLSGFRMPVGEQLIKIRFYLEFLGYTVEELEQMDPTIRDAARIFAFGIVSLTEIAELVGLSHDINSLLRMFRGVRNATPHRLQQFSSFIELYEPQLDDKKRRVPKVIMTAKENPPSQRTFERSDHSALTIAVPKTRANQSAVIESFTGLITALLPLAEYVLSDSFTAADRDMIRERAGGGMGVSRLSNLFTQLSGEAVRTALTNSNKKEDRQ